MLNLAAVCKKPGISQQFTVVAAIAQTMTAQTAVTKSTTVRSCGAGDVDAGQ